MNNISNFEVGVVGNCYFDEVYTISSFPKPDDKITALDMTVSLGGSATNTSAGLVKLGINPKLLSVIGSDNSGKQIIDELNLRKINPNFLTKIPGQTGRTIILLDENKNSTKIGYPGVAKDLISAFASSEVLENEFDIIHLASVDIETAMYISENAKYKYLSLDFGARTLNASNQAIFDFLEKLDIVFFNRNVYHRLFENSQIDNPTLKSIEIPCHMVLTAGKEGIYAKIDDEVYFHPIFKVEVLDTTGAGDAAAASILRGFLDNWSWEKNLQFASASAAIKLQTYGASNGHPTLEEIVSFVSNHS